MNERREIVKASWLQHVVHKKGGTLHRKKKVLYEEGKWVVLCVHNDRIPLLEWYVSEECVHEHRPSKVVDLLNSSFVRVVISDPSRRSFMIGFLDCSRDPIELSALTAEDCDDWIHLATSTLVRLQCITESTNLYISIPDISTPSPRTAERSGFQEAEPADDEVPEGLAPFPPPVPSPRSSEYVHIGLPSLATQAMRIPALPRTLSNEEKKMKSPAVVKTPPPLPPRNISSAQVQIPVVSMKHNSIYDHPKNHASTSVDESPTVDHPGRASTNSHNSVYSTLETSALDIEIKAPVDLCVEPVKRGYSVPVGTLNVSVTQSRRMTTDGSFSPNYDSPCGTLNRLSSVTNKPSEKYCPMGQSNGPVHSHDNTRSQWVDNCRISNGVENLSVSPIMCSQHIAFVEFGGKVWISGWTALAEKTHKGELHVGDQLLRVGDVDVHSVQQISSIFRAPAKPGLPVNITIQQVPHGTVYTLQKAKQEFDAGFTLDKHKIRLADVREGSEAWKAGIRATVTAVTRTGLAPACITCINGHALNLFSQDDEILKEIDALPPDSTFSVVVQSYDFVKFLKKGLKKLKNMSDFVR